MSKASFQQWIRNNLGTPGVLGFGISSPGKASFVESCASGFSPEALENAWRCVAETIPVMQLNHFPTARFRFVYTQAVVHCERRRDGTCLGIFAVKGHQFEQDDLYRLLNEFHAL
jgi:hypothetical protein